MATTDRYVFAKVLYGRVCDTPGCTVPHPFVAISEPEMRDTIPAPSPEDWQAIEDAVDRGRQHNAPDIAVAIAAGTAAIAAVRNMREVDGDEGA